MKFIVCAFALLLPLCSIADTTLNDVINLYTQSAGGKTALESVRSVEMLLTIKEPKFTVDAIYRADRNIRMRIDILAEGKRVFTEAFDGKSGWEMGENGEAKEASPQAATALRNGIFYPGKVFGLHELSGLGHQLSYQGREEVDHVLYHVLKLTLDSGDQKLFYIHPENGRIERTRDFQALHVDIDPTKQLFESRLSDFRTVRGILFAFQSEQVDLNTNEVVQTTTLKEIRLNPDLKDALFQRGAPAGSLK